MSLASLMLASETNDLLDAATKGQNLTDRGLLLVFVGLLVVLLVSFAKVQLGKETRLIEQQAKLSQDANQVIQQNTRCGEALIRDLDLVKEELKEIQRELQENRARRARAQ